MTGTTNRPLDPFETALLGELRAVVADRAAVPQARRSVRRPRRLLLAAAAVAVGTAVVAPALTAEPAFSVQEGNDGEIRVEVNRIEDAAGLEDSLRRFGIASDITYVPGGGRCADRGLADRSVTRSGLTVGVGERTFQLTLPPGAVRDGETLVVWVSGRPIPDGFAGSVEAGVVTGPVPPCVVVP